MSERPRTWTARPRYAAPPPGEEAEEPPAAELPPPHPGRIRRERRRLVRRREQEIRDLGGLLLEMVRRDRLKESLLMERCGEILQLEQRMHELDALMANAAAASRGAGRAVPLCRCGAPLAPGSHFCAHCGRPAPGPPVVACRHCGQPLPAESNFCAFCGASAVADESGRGDPDATIVRPGGER
jgi:hypothetical protein